MTSASSLLSQVLVDVATAVTASQKELDRLANQSTNNLPLAPLAFVVKQTQVTLQGSLHMRRGEALTFSKMERVQTALGGQTSAALSNRVSVLIEALVPPHGC